MQNAVEPPLGYSVEEIEPVGEVHEVAASLGRSVGSSAPAPAMDRAVLPGEGSSPLLETTTTRPSTTGAAALRMRRLR